MKNYIVYMHVAPSGKRYIGITCTTVEKRWKNGKGYNDCPLFFNAIQKYGWDNIQHVVLYEELTAKQAKAKEKELIRSLNTNDRRYGYNLTSGGDGAEGYRHNEEVRQKMRKNHADVSGENNPMYGVRLTGRLNHSFGKRPSEETRLKISQANKGRKLSQEQIEKLKRDNAGSRNYFYGKAGAKSLVARRVAQCTKDGQVIKIWDCISDASRQLNIFPQSICRSCKTTRNAGGFAWKYA